MSYEHLTALDDPAKPYKRVWKITGHGDPIYVKTYAVRRENAGFGRLKWDITGSLCDETGSVIEGPGGEALIHIEPHGFSVQTDAGIRKPDAEALLRDLVADNEATTANSVRNRARQLFAEAPTVEQIGTKIAEDFEAELRFIVAKVERAALIHNFGQLHGGVKA